MYGTLCVEVQFYDISIIKIRTFFAAYQPENDRKTRNESCRVLNFVLIPLPYLIYRFFFRYGSYCLQVLSLYYFHLMKPKK